MSVKSENISKNFISLNKKLLKLPKIKSRISSNATSSTSSRHLLVNDKNFKRNLKPSIVAAQPTSFKMSTPIEQMILDAKRLANRLKEKEQLADVLSNETERVNYQLESMRQFQDDINALNILARERSNADMIHTIHQENPQIREIQQENRQLKASIEEHQRAIELIMTKYRQHTQRQIEETKLNFDKLVKSSEMNDCTNIISSQAQQLQSAIGVMQDAIKMGDEDMNKYVEQLMQLKTENQGLRELLGIASSMNSILIEREKKETATQTDEESSVKS